MTEDGFVKGMYKLSLQWKDHEMAGDVVALYRERLDHLTDEQFMASVNHCLDNCRWFPKISELLEIHRVTPPGARQAWQRLLELASGDPPPDSELSPAELAGLKAVGGWQVLGFTSMDELRFLFKDFQAAYQDTQKEALGISQVGHEVKRIG